MFKKNIEGKPINNESDFIGKKNLKNLLQCDSTFFSSIILGKRMLSFFIYSLIFVYFIIPWDSLYNIPAYQSFINFMANFDPNIEKIRSGYIAFPEYAMSFVAFCDLVGPIIGLFYLFYGFFHPKYINIFVFRGLSLSSKLLLFFGGSVFSFLVALGLIYHWHGGGFFNYTWLHESKLLFIFFMMFIWWGFYIGCFFITSFPMSLWLACKHR